MLNKKEIEKSIYVNSKSKNSDQIKSVIENNKEILSQEILCPPFEGLASSVLMHLSAQMNDIDLCKIALGFGATIDATCSFPPGNDTPLETAASQGSIDVVRFLLKNGANVDGLQINATSPLISALSVSRSAEEAQNCDEIVRLLVEQGADVNRLHRNMHLTPLDICRMWGREEIEPFLIEHGAIGEPREPVDWDKIPGAGILLHVESKAGHVLPVILHSPQTDENVVFRQAIVNKKFRLLFTHGLFNTSSPQIELYSLLPLRWPMNKDVVQSDSLYSFPIHALAKLIGTENGQLKHGYFVERTTDGWHNLPWPADVEGLALVDHQWSKAPDSENLPPDHDVNDKSENWVSLLLVQPLSASALQKIKSKKSDEWFEKAMKNKWHQVVYPEIE